MTRSWCLPSSSTGRVCLGALVLLPGVALLVCCLLCYIERYTGADVVILVDVAVIPAWIFFISALAFFFSGIFLVALGVAVLNYKVVKRSDGFAWFVAVDDQMFPPGGDGNSGKDELKTELVA